VSGGNTAGAALAAPAPYVAVVGASQATDADLDDAEAVGRNLAQAGAVVVCGGRGGVMAAAAHGAAQARGTVIGMLPGLDRSDANPWVTHAIPTGLGELRNGLIVRTAEAVIAVGGAYGTLSEVALALTAGLEVFGLHTWEIEGITAVDSPAAAVTAALHAAARWRTVRRT
jgi:uncharacterized protein (TIGR00725 family)